jgi:hypothetical protein
MTLLPGNCSAKRSGQKILLKGFNGKRCGFFSCHRNRGFLPSLDLQETFSKWLAVSQPEIE